MQNLRRIGHGNFLAGILLLSTLVAGCNNRMATTNQHTASTPAAHKVTAMADCASMPGGDGGPDVGCGAARPDGDGTLAPTGPTLSFANNCGGSALIRYPVSDPAAGKFAAPQTVNFYSDLGICSTDPSGTHLYAPQGGLPSIVNVFNIDSTTGVLTAGASATIDATRNTLPEKSIVDPTGSFLFVINQTTNQVSSFLINPADGCLTAAAGTSFPTPGFVAINTRVLVAHPSGRFLYVNAAIATSGGIVPFTVDPTTGVLTQGTPVPLASGASTNDIAIDPSGTRLYVATSSSNVQVFNINPTDGSLVTPGTTIAMPNSPAKLAFDRSGKFLYVTFDGGIAGNLRAYSMNLYGALTEMTGSPYTATGVQSTDVHNVPNAFATTNAFSSVAEESTGQFLYVSSLFSQYGSDGFSISLTGGKLTHIGSTTRIPRDFRVVGNNTNVLMFTTK